jgi:hypothetical protein
MVLERGTHPKHSRRTCSPWHGLQSCWRGKSAGVAKRPRELSPTRNPYRYIRNFCIAVSPLPVQPVYVRPAVAQDLATIVNAYRDTSSSQPVNTVRGGQVALFRICELAGGSICVDGLDLARMALADVRGKGMAIIPQEPLLLAGSLRRNLDPLQQHADAQLWAVLLRSKSCES